MLDTGWACGYIKTETVWYTQHRYTTEIIDACPIFRKWIGQSTQKFYYANWKKGAYYALTPLPEKPEVEPPPAQGSLF